MIVLQWRHLKRSRLKRTSRAERAGSLERVRPLSRRQHLALMVLTYTLTVALCGFLDLGAFDYLEQYAGQVRQGVFHSVNTDVIERAREQIVLILIRDKTFEKLPGAPSPPVPRRMQAQLVHDLCRAGVRLIAFDLVFDVPSAQDTELAAAAQASGGRVLWASLIEEHDPERPVLPVSELKNASPHYGHIEVPPDPNILTVDSIDPVLVDSAGRTTPALSLAAAQAAQGRADEPLWPAPPDWAGGGWMAGDLRVPADRNGRFHIAYLGPPNKVFIHTVFYEDVYRNVDPALFRDKIVLVGDVTTVGSDHRFTPVGDMDGVEMHAHAVANFLNRIFVIEAPAWLNLTVLCLLAALIAPLAATLPLARVTLAIGGLAATYGVFNVWLFATQWVELHFIGPAVGLLVSAMTIVVQRGLLEEREKHRMLGLLRRYVSPQVAAYVIANPEKCVLGGERVTATVLFSDVRGFTALSEGLAPEEVVTRLNEYLQAMTDVVFRHEGTVDKYVGDGIMALFGVPVPHLDHARRAVRTALDMEAALLTMQGHWQAQGLPVLDIGIGIHTGEMVVGNIGSHEQQNFTVIGDSVNLASRVEGLSKELHCRILITEATYRLVRSEIEVRGPFQATVRGKAEPVTVYDVAGRRSAEQSIGSGPSFAVPNVTPRAGRDAPSPTSV